MKLWSTRESMTRSVRMAVFDPVSGAFTLALLIEVPEFLETDTFLVQGTTKEVGKFEGSTMNRNVNFFRRTVSR